MNLTDFTIGSEWAAQLCKKMNRISSLDDQHTCTCEKRCGNAAFNFFFVSCSKQAIYTSVHASHAPVHKINNDNDHYRTITEKLDKNVYAGNKNDAGRPEMKQDLFCGLTHTCINNIDICRDISQLSSAGEERLHGSLDST